ncbi:hypothetical protein ACFQ0G_11920 [Streptomyces chiangmaiensis]
MRCPASSCFSRSPPRPSGSSSAIARAFNRTKRPRLPAAAPAQPAATPAWVYRPEDYGLVADELLDTRLPGPDTELVKALEAASTGDWAPASELLAASDPEWRWIRVTVLASAAAEDDSWVRAWRAARPGDAAAVLVSAESLVALAWKLRGNRGAKDTTREQFENFHRVLAQASGALAEAARLAPEDPCPYIAMIRVALGEGWAHEHMHALWREVVVRAPHHVGAHSAALQYWCAKWRGSDEHMHAFAESAVAQAPAGSLLPLLRLIALFEELHEEQRSHPRYQSAEATAAIDALFADLAMAPPGHPGCPPRAICWSGSCGRSAARSRRRSNCAWWTASSVRCRGGTTLTRWPSIALSARTSSSQRRT